MTTPPAPHYFASAADVRRWLETHHDSQRELVVGFHKVGTGTPSMTFFEQQPPSYRRTATWRVISAKQPATRARQQQQEQQEHGDHGFRRSHR